MDKRELLEKLNEVFCDVFDEEITVTEDTKMEDIEGWDSLMQISLLAAIQDEYNIEFSLEEVVQMKNVKLIIEGIEEKL